jgi:hypothetical protein
MLHFLELAGSWGAVKISPWGYYPNLRAEFGAYGASIRQGTSWNHLAFLCNHEAHRERSSNQRKRGQRPEAEDRSDAPQQRAVPKSDEDGSCGFAPAQVKTVTLASAERSPVCRLVAAISLLVAAAIFAVLLPGGL